MFDFNTWENIIFICQKVLFALKSVKLKCQQCDSPTNRLNYVPKITNQQWEKLI